MFESIITALSLPLKIFAMAVLSAFARIFHENEELKVSLIAMRIITSTFILWVVYVGASELFNLSSNVSLVSAGIASFAYREILDFWLGIARNPTQMINLKDLKIKKNEKEK